MSVSTRPGATTLTWMPCRRSSFASVTPALPSPPCPCCTARRSRRVRRRHRRDHHDVAAADRRRALTDRRQRHAARWCGPSAWVATTRIISSGSVSATDATLATRCRRCRRGCRSRRSRRRRPSTSDAHSPASSTDAANAARRTSGCRDRYTVSAAASRRGGSSRHGRALRSEQLADAAADPSAAAVTSAIRPSSSPMIPISLCTCASGGLVRSASTWQPRRCTNAARRRPSRRPRPAVRRRGDGTPRRRRPLGLIAVCIAILCFSSSSSLIRKAGIPGPTTAWWRLLATIPVWWVILWVTERRTIDRADLRRAAAARHPLRAQPHALLRGCQPHVDRERRVHRRR